MSTWYKADKLQQLKFSNSRWQHYLVSKHTPSSSTHTHISQKGDNLGTSKQFHQKLHNVLNIFLAEINLWGPWKRSSHAILVLRQKVCFMMMVLTICHKRTHTHTHTHTHTQTHTQTCAVIFNMASVAFHWNIHPGSSIDDHPSACTVKPTRKSVDFYVYCDQPMASPNRDITTAMLIT